MIKKQLKDIITDIDSGMRPKGGVSTTSGTIPSLGAEHLSDGGNFHFDNIKYITESFFKSMNKGKIEKNNILLVKDGATTGKICFVDESFPYGVAAINEHLFRIIPDKSKIFPKYLFWYLFSQSGNRQIMNDFRGATVGGISRNIIEIVEVPLTNKKSIKEQIKDQI
ncbi:restriction endonuclease subunit S, partial [Bacteroidetes/Chlorobi group bacterium ChocPot_Mid]